MTGPEEMFAGFDDPAGVPGRLPDIETVVARGRHLRTRRYAAIGGSAAAIVAVVAVAAFATVPGLNAGRTGHSVVPATNATVSVTGSEHARGVGAGGGNDVIGVRPGGPVQRPPQHPLPTSAVVVQPPVCGHTTSTPPSPAPAPTDGPVASASPGHHPGWSPCLSPSGSPSAEPPPTVTSSAVVVDPTPDDSPSGVASS